MGKFSTEEEAIRLANDTSYGLGAGFHSSELNAKKEEADSKMD